MPIVSLRIPQIGEGLQEARLVGVLKQPGETVRRDEPIYQMETDKAVMDVESPYEGVLKEWVGKVDELLAIGAVVATMDVADGVEEVPPSHEPPVSQTDVPMAAPTAPAATRRLDVPPRTRAYAKEKGLSEDELATVPAKGTKLMPEDIDAFLSGAVEKPFDEAALPQKQRLLNARMVRGQQLCVPGTMTVVARWTAIETQRETQRASGGDFQPSAFTMFAFAVAQSLKSHPSFRSSLVGDATLRTYRHCNLGIAVGLPGDELVLAVVPESDTLDWRTFAETTKQKIDLARTGKDQVDETVTVSLTNLQAQAVRDGIPVVVPPAVATLFLGEPYWGFEPGADVPAPCKLVNLGLTFDHRIANGMGAAAFLADVRNKLENISDVLK